MAEALAAFADGRLDASEPYLWCAVPDALTAILAERHGWEAVRGPGPMTWREAQLSLQLAAEERKGTAMRIAQEIALRREDAAYAALRAQTGGVT